MKIKNFKKDFPIFLNNKNLVYLDSAATSQKPKIVIDAITNYYQFFNSNVRRGLYPIAEKATEEVEKVRKKVARFINAKYPEEIIFVRNTTEAINLITYTFGEEFIQKDDFITTTIMEHHSNFVPWQVLANKLNAKFNVLDVDRNLKFQISTLKSNPNIQKSKILAITHISNVLGTINPIEQIIRTVKKKNPKILVLVDAAQSIPHMKVDVQKLDCDFLTFSGHKMMAAMGIGVLYGKKDILKQIKPFLYGGDMINEVSTKKTTFAELPYKFEAGTPDVAGIISLGAAIDYLEKIGMDNIQKHEKELTNYCLEKMKKIDGLIIYGSKNTEDKSGVISFNLEKIHAHDVAQILGDVGICIRTGHHCAEPLHNRLGIQASCRVSFYLYNDFDDIIKLIKGIKKVKKIFKQL